MNKKFPPGMVPLADEPFSFACHPKVACFTRCCKNVDMFLFPYDLLRLRRTLSMDSGTFIEKHTRLAQGENPYFPALMLKLDERGWCPFLTEAGCSVYDDRPSACRTYPLERALDRNPGPGEQREFYFLTNHDYCLGHYEKAMVTVRQWVRSQRLDQYNTMNDLWGELDTLFSTNPWKGEGAGGEKQRLAFMVCFDVDRFREFVEHHDMLRQFRLPKDVKNRIRKEDEELLKFGFEWLKMLLAAKSSLVRR